MILRYPNNIVRVRYGGTNQPVFTLSEQNSWGFKEYYYKHEELIGELSLQELNTHRSNKLLDTDKVYFTKSSSIPRYKLKEYLDHTKLNLKKTNRIDTADTYIVGYNAFKTLIYDVDKTDYNTYYEVPVDDFAPIAERGFKRKCTDRGLDKVLVRKSEIEYAPTLNVSGYPITRIHEIGDNWGSNKLSNIIESFIYIANKKDRIKIIFDETLIESCNEGVIIDDEIYSNLKKMFEGGNKENISLALEIMANSDFTKSGLYILLLLNEYNLKIRQVPKTTNYQSMLNYFVEHSSDALYNTWEIFADRLLRKVCKTAEEKLIVKTYILNCFNNFLSQRKIKFKLKDIEI